MISFEEFMKEKNKQNIIDEILDLKLKPQSEDVKLRIQKLQQKLSKRSE